MSSVAPAPAWTQANLLFVYVINETVYVTSLLCACRSKFGLAFVKSPASHESKSILKLNCSYPSEDNEVERYVEIVVEVNIKTQ